MAYCPTYRSYTITGVNGNDPVTTAEAKTHLRVDHSDDDTYIGTLITAATQAAENYLGMALRDMNVTEYHDGWPAVIELRWPIVQSVTQIQYVDEDGNTQTLDSSKYKTDLIKAPARIEQAYNETWPTLRNEMNNVIITYRTEEYQATLGVPEVIQQAILLMVGKWYECREDSVYKLPTAAQYLLNQYKVYDL